MEKVLNKIMVAGLILITPALPVYFLVSLLLVESSLKIAQTAKVRSQTLSVVVSVLWNSHETGMEIIFTECI